MEISDAIKYVGVDDAEMDLFESQYHTPDGMCYNSYVILDEKVAVMDTVDIRKTDEWMENLKTALAGRTPDYVVIQHLEPDHSGSLSIFFKAYPETTVVASQKAIQFIGQFFEHLEFKSIAVTEGDTLNLGQHCLHFVTAPMVHWPEVIVSYESTEQVLFSADGFGKFGVYEADADDWACEARRYYFNICGKYGNNVASLLKKTKDEVADIKSDFNFTVTEITHYTEAEINQELFDKVLGKDAVKSEADFKEKIKEDIKKTLVDDADYKFAQDARKALIKKNEKVAFPEAFLKRWALTTNKDLTQEKLDADFSAMLDELKWHLVQEKIAKENDIKVEDGDIEEFAKKVAKSQFAQYGMTNVPDEILSGYVADMKKDQKAIQNMVNGVINEKINGIIKNAAKLDEKEISLDDFNKLLQDEK